MGSPEKYFQHLKSINQPELLKTSINKLIRKSHLKNRPPWLHHLRQQTWQLCPELHQDLRPLLDVVKVRVDPGVGGRAGRGGPGAELGVS